MAIFINVYQDKRKNSNKLFYGRAMHPQTIDTRALAKRIEKNVSVKESDVYAVLIELADVMNEELSNSNKVQLDRFGYFSVGVSTSGALQAKDWSVAENLKGSKINFQTIRTMSNGKVTSKTFGYDMKFVKYAEEGVIVAPKKQEEDPGE